MLILATVAIFLAANFPGVSPGIFPGTFPASFWGAFFLAVGAAAVGAAAAVCSTLCCSFWYSFSLIRQFFGLHLWSVRARPMRRKGYSGHGLKIRALWLWSQGVKVRVIRSRPWG